MGPPRSSRGVFGVPRRRFRHFQPLLGVIRGVGFHLARVPRSLGSHGSSMRNQKTDGTPEEKKRKKKTTMKIYRFVPGGKENMGTPEVFSWEKITWKPPSLFFENPATHGKGTELSGKKSFIRSIPPGLDVLGKNHAAKPQG